MRFEDFSFGSIRIDGVAYEHDVVIDRGEIRKRKKSRSRNSAMTSDTRRCRWKKTYLGSATGWWSAPGPTAPCR